MNEFAPKTGSPDDWNTAYYRLEDYLRSHGVLNKIQQSQIILRLLRRAATVHQKDPSQSPVALAMREAYAELAHWFGRIFPDNQISSARLCSMGRVGLYLINASERWPHVFLSEDELPSDFTSAMQDTMVRSGPDLSISTMIPKAPDMPSLATLTEHGLQRLTSTLSVKLFATLAIGMIFLP